MTDRPTPDPNLPWVDRILIRVEVGSTAHGTGLPGHEDYDEIGVMGLPWEHTLGIPIRSPQDDTIVYRPGRTNDERSEPGDYDLTVHAARKFCHLASKGNPSLLMVLFGPVTFTTPLGDDLRALADAFWTQRARHAFLGYARAQRERLEGIRGGAHTNRPELVDQHGYDTKYAMHMLRLGIQGIEYMQTGRFTIPIPDSDAEFLRAVRRGEVALLEVLAIAERNEQILLSADTMLHAPPEPDYERINNWLRDVHHYFDHDWLRDVHHFDSKGNR